MDTMNNDSLAAYEWLDDKCDDPVYQGLNYRKIKLGFFEKNESKFFFLKTILVAV